jgi:hypothetical protein
MAAWKLCDINGHQIYVVYPEKNANAYLLEKKVNYSVKTLRCYSKQASRAKQQLVLFVTYLHY